MSDPISLAASAIGSGVELARKLLGAHGDQQLKGEIVELMGVLATAQGNLMAAHVANSSLLRQQQDLEEELQRLKDWSIERGRYAMVPPWQHSAAVAYGVRESQSNGEPPHLLCPNCFAQSKKSFLTPYETARTKDVNIRHGLGCPCGTKLAWDYNSPPPTPEYAPG